MRENSDSWVLLQLYCQVYKHTSLWRDPFNCRTVFCGNLAPLVNFSIIRACKSGTSDDWQHPWNPIHAVLVPLAILLLSTGQKGPIPCPDTFLSTGWGLQRRPQVLLHTTNKAFWSQNKSYTRKIRRHQDKENHQAPVAFHSVLLKGATIFLWFGKK